MRQKAVFHAAHMREIKGRPSQLLTSLWKVLSRKDGCQGHHDELMFAMGMPARFAFFWGSSSMMMYWGIPSACT